jgi:hypothetical protein
LKFFDQQKAFNLVSTPNDADEDDKDDRQLQDDGLLGSGKFSPN